MEFIYVLHTFLFTLAWCLMSAAASDESEERVEAKGDWVVVTPRQVEAHLEQQRDALLAAMERHPVLLLQEDFEGYAVGRLGEGVHGESVFGGNVLLGYPGEAPLSDVFYAAVVKNRGGHAMCLVDRQSQATLYARLLVGEACGRVAFDVVSPEGEPLVITLGAYQAALVVPSERDWQQWFEGQPYVPCFVYLAGEREGYMPQEAFRENYRPINTRVRLQPRARYRVMIEWDHQSKQASVWINEKKVIRAERFLSNVGGKTDFVTFRPGSFLRGGLWDDGEIQIDQVEVNALVWSLQDSEK